MKDKKTLLSSGEISIILDTYDDIFSDFDPRPYAQRALSDDFLSESKKASVEKGKSLQLSFLIPKKMRSLGYETVIKRRLREHFRKHADILRVETKRIFRKGLIFSVIGVTLMFIASLLMDYTATNLLLRMPFLVLEPASWFSIWTGFEHMINPSKEREKDLIFYEKMKNVTIVFNDY